MEKEMVLSYDPEGDLLEIIFDEALHRTEQKAYQLRDGLMLFTTTDSMKPVQLTIVNYLKLAKLPVFQFNGWNRLKPNDRKKLLPLLNSPMLSSIVKFDPKTGYGHLASPRLLEMFSAAAR